MSKFNPIDYLRVIAFILTIVLVFYGISKGFDTVKYFINIIYFVIIIVVLAYDNKEIFLKE